MTQFKPLTPEEEEIGKVIVNAAFEVHKRLGPGLLEKVYEVCLSHELKKGTCLFKDKLIYLFNTMI
jgi:GxxExxY protein